MIINRELTENTFIGENTKILNKQTGLLTFAEQLKYSTNVSWGKTWGILVTWDFCKCNTQTSAVEEGSSRSITDLELCISVPEEHKDSERHRGLVRRESDLPCWELLRGKVVSEKLRDLQKVGRKEKDQEDCAEGKFSLNLYFISFNCSK